MPKDLKEQRIASEDACQVTYTSPAINIWFDFGPSEAAVLRQERMAGYTESEITLDTRRARLVTYRDDRLQKIRISYPVVTEIYLPILDDPQHGRALTLIISTADTISRETAKRIYESLRYTKK